MKQQMLKLSDATINKMRKWLRDLDRATINRDKETIIHLLQAGQSNDKFIWSAVEEDLYIDFNEFVERANAIIGY